MTHRPDPITDQGDPARPRDVPDSSRRVLLRGAALLGLAGVTGTLGACGRGEGSAVTSAGPAPEPVSAPAADPPPRLPTKSEVYKRPPEPRTPKAKADAAAKAADPTTEVAGPPPREADLKPAAAKAEAKADAKADAKTGATTAKADPKPAARATKGDGAETAARAPRDAAKPKKGAPAAAPHAEPAGPPPVVAPSMAGAKTSDIPVGGGRIYTAEKVVVTQPTKGDFKAFSAVCTHQGCTVSTIDKGTITCFCHGSQYGIADGIVKRGPAMLPLPPQKITVTGDTIAKG